MHANAWKSFNVRFKKHTSSRKRERDWERRINHCFPILRPIFLFFSFLISLCACARTIPFFFTVSLQFAHRQNEVPHFSRDTLSLYCSQIDGKCWAYSSFFFLLLKTLWRVFFFFRRATWNACAIVSWMEYSIFANA